MVGTEVEAHLRGCISGQDAALALNGFGGEIVQCGIANADDAEISGAPPSPVAEVIEIDIRDGAGDSGIFLPLAVIAMVPRERMPYRGTFCTKPPVGVPGWRPMALICERT
jgi:hypothetical protein